MDIKTQIKDLLRETETKERVSILYACESGSRAWGFASPNSDYDIRFLYKSSTDYYLSVFENKDTIEIPIKDDLDPGGWDIKKALNLLAKSNGALIEWLHSPIIYNDALEFRENWQRIITETLNPRHLINHYKGLAVQITKKKLATRALLAAKSIENTLSPPPVPFIELIDFAPPELQKVLLDTVQWKESADEVASMGRIAAIDHFIQTEINPNKKLASLPEPNSEHVRKIINAEYRRLIQI